MVEVFQPEGSNLCGPACVASILELDLEAAADLIGKRGLTTTKHLREALAKHGLTLGGRQTTRPPGMGIARVHWAKKPLPGRKTKDTHWVVFLADGGIFDPVFGRYEDPSDVAEGAYVTSWYLITGGSTS